uniref:Uncharacterized protein n=1 Tax=Arundo donax TaxID=35708 RepID=A0A0A8XVF9_ARUDO
MPVVPARVRVL